MHLLSNMFIFTSIFKAKRLNSVTSLSCKEKLSVCLSSFPVSRQKLLVVPVVGVPP